MLSSSPSGIEQESLPTVSSSVNLRVSGTHRCSPLVYLHLKRSLFLQLKLYTWGPCLATGGANHKVSPKLLDVYICLWLYWITQHCDYEVHVFSYALSNKWFEFEFELIWKSHILVNVIVNFFTQVQNLIYCILLFTSL